MTRRRVLILVLVGVLAGALAAYAVPRLRGNPGGAGDFASHSASPGTPGSSAAAGPITLSEQEVSALALRSLPAPQERFYFVMADRFANGDPRNDRGGRTGDRIATGFDPTDKGFFHGGDLAGLKGELDYIKGMGTTAIWLTPSFTNRVVQGPAGEESAGYHGYWITDFTAIDPHFGTNAEFKDLIDAAHAKGMKVFLDIVTNHTADVIDYRGGQHDYVAKATKPYLDATGKPFDDAALAGSPAFPPMAAEKSFPYQPIWRTPADATAKTPAWLNDPTLYHNRGDSTFSGESSTYGDFSGLDDLFSENPKVVDGMIAIYNTWVDLGVDGFRIDTVKHVNLGFWQMFGPAVMDHAKAAGNDHFFMFGEVYDTSAGAMSEYTTRGRLPATLDFGFQSAAVDFVSGHSATRLHDLYAADDLYTDVDSNAYSLPTFLGNHDMGRVGSFLVGASDDDADLLDRDRLAMSLMYLTRGQPITYYGDEQGFMGWGGDKDARQDMFATKVAQYAEERVIDSPTGSMPRYDTDHVLYQHLAALALLRDEHPALAGGIQIERVVGTGDQEGVYVFSRIDRDSSTEYVVGVNNGASEALVTVPTASPATAFRTVFGGADTTSAANGDLRMTVPRRGVAVLRAEKPIPPVVAAPTVTLSIGSGTPISGSVKLGATVVGGPAEVTFATRAQGSQEWSIAGTDDNPDYAAYGDLSGLKPGTRFDAVAVVRTLDGTTAYAVGAGQVAAAADAGAGPMITAPGSFQSKAGCTKDWDPVCSATTLTDPDGDGTYLLTVSSLPAGDYELKIAVGGSWDENYGAGGARGGQNVAFTVVTDQAPVTISYVAGTHDVTVTGG